MNRNLDGVYFRIKRDDKFENVCFSDMTDEERDEIWEKNQDAQYWKRMAYIMADALKNIGDYFDLVRD